MSYNIDTWKTKRLENLRLSLAAMDECGDWFKEPRLQRDGTFFIGGGAEGFEITCAIDGDTILVSSITLYGEASGTMYRDALAPVLKRSTGTLIASLVWEGGDSITRLTVRDGVITDEEIDI